MHIADFLKNKNLLIVAISLAIVFLLLLSSSFFHVLNKSIQNNYYAIKNTLTGLHANPHIIIVDIDEKSFKEIGTFPFPRSVYAQALNNLKEYDEAVVAFDLLFLDPSNPESDDVFIGALKETSNDILGAAINNKGEVQLPYSEIPYNTYDTGFLPPNIDTSNRTVYSFSPRFTSQGENKTYEHFSIRILRQFYSFLYRDQDLLEQGEYSESHYNFSSDMSFPLAQSGGKDILINFISGDNFTRISFSDLYSAERLREVEKEIGLTDKILLIGPAAEGMKDEFFTPNGVEYGVNIHANILNTLLSRQFMMYFDKYLEWLLIFFLIVLSVSVNLSSSLKTLLLGNILIILIFWFIIPLSILIGTNLIFNYPSEIIFSLVLAFSSANIVKYLIEDANKMKLNFALSQYVSSNIAEEILEGSGQVNLNGEKRSLGCFFSDIEGFTNLSEELSPEELVSFLREYLSHMTKIIMDKKGHVDKFEGDAIMALWGTFSEYEKKDSQAMCLSALAQQRVLQEINLKWKEKLGKDIHVRMGIHSGEAIVGNIGAIGQKMEFTALGDDVNIASRLEGVNKYYGTHICVSETVFSDVKKYFRFRFLDTIQVKGKEKSIKIYELLGEIDMYLSDEQEAIYKDFSDGLDLYLLQNFAGAQEKFSKLSALGDLPSATFVKRCQYYIENPPGDDWTGVWRMTEK